MKDITANLIDISDRLNLRLDELYAIAHLIYQAKGGIDGNNTAGLSMILENICEEIDSIKLVVNSLIERKEEENTG